MNQTYPAQAAREAAGLSLEQAAKKARVHPRYLRDCELRGDFTYVLAERLARIYSCSLNSFLPTARATQRLDTRRGPGQGAAPGPHRGRTTSQPRKDAA